jgi:2-dehydropantoate 2-reductase
MRVAVFGVGGVGGYFGGRLAQAGAEVHFIARGAHLLAMRDYGLQIESPKGDLTIKPINATDDPARVGPVDVVLLGVKTWQVPDAARAMLPLIGPETAVVPLLNGIEAPDQLVPVIGAEHTLGGLCKIIAAIESPGHIRHSGIEPSVAFGELDNRLSPRVVALRKLFAQSGVIVEEPADIQVAMWMKFLLICTWSGLGSITRAPIGVWRSLPETRALAERSLAEIAVVARARGVQLPPDAAERTLAFIDSVPPAGTASMQRDIAEGRPSELEAQNGAVVRLATAAGVATPLHSFIYTCLLPQERKARGELEGAPA